jgi:hypothetical protein
MSHRCHCLYDLYDLFDLFDISNHPLHFSKIKFFFYGMLNN